MLSLVRSYGCVLVDQVAITWLTPWLSYGYLWLSLDRQHGSHLLRGCHLAYHVEKKLADQTAVTLLTMWLSLDWPRGCHLTDHVAVTWLTTWLSLDWPRGCHTDHVALTWLTTWLSLVWPRGCHLTDHVAVIWLITWLLRDWLKDSPHDCRSSLSTGLLSILTWFCKQQCIKAKLHMDVYWWNRFPSNNFFTNLAKYLWRRGTTYLKI